MALLVRGVSIEALEDTFVKACVRGAINKDSLTQKEPEAIIDLAIMREIRNWLKNQNMPLQRKRFLWCVCSFLFMGSLREDMNRPNDDWIGPNND